tara:strand:+ start:795 stop:1145 length:351 start_codon:yes stop_codon:yes gene_type:complete
MIFEALRELCPECDFIVTDEVLTWRSAPSLRPTDEEIQKKVDELTAQLPMKQLRQHRDMLLSQCDYKMVSDYKHKNKQEWIDYRQALRDLPDTIKEQNIVLEADLSNVVFPTSPSS